MSALVAGPPPLLERSVIDGARILIVDDEEANTELLAQVLEAEGFSEIRCCANASVALDLFRRFSPDLVILDLHMPGLDGGDLLRKLNDSLPEGGFVPTMVITADVSEQARDRAFLCGAADFLTKPFDIHECILRVRNLLHIRHLNVLQAQRNALLARRIEVRELADERRAAQRLDIHRRLDDVVRSGGPTIVFQPIETITDRRTVGFEALSRFDDPEGRSPDTWFADASSVGRGVELEICAIQGALEAFDQIAPDEFLSVNASAHTIMSGELARIVGEHDASRVVIELTEHEQVPSYEELLAAIAPLRAAGATIAVDDAGTGFAGLEHILRIGPDIIKLDRCLITGVDHDPIRQSLVTAMVSFSISIGARLLGEGIETDDELATLRDLGVPLGQGYLLGRPAPIERSKRCTELVALTGPA